MYQLANENIENIEFFNVSKEDIASYTSIIQNRLNIAETYGGTRNYHCFGVNDQTKLELYTLSADEIFVIKNLRPSEWLFVDTDCLKTGHYVAAVCEGQCYPSLTLETNWDQKDLLVKQKLLMTITRKTASFGHPEMIYIMFHSPTLLDLLKCQILWEDMDETVTKSMQNFLNYLTQI